MGNSKLKFTWIVKNEYPDVQKYIKEEPTNSWNEQKKINLVVPEFELTKRNSQFNVFFKWPSIFPFKSVYIYYINHEYHIECEFEE